MIPAAHKVRQEAANANSSPVVCAGHPLVAKLFDVEIGVAVAAVCVTPPASCVVFSRPPLSPALFCSIS